MSDPFSRKKALAIITGGISVLIGVLYLILIVILDSRGSMTPPPPEAFGAVGAAYVDFFSMARLFFRVLCL